MSLRRLLISFFIITMFILMSCSSVSVSGENARKDPEITINHARAEAFKECKVKAANATVTRRKLVYRSGKPYYLICFSTQQKSDRVSYECFVNGDTGVVENIDKQVQSTSHFTEAGAEPQESGADDYIGVEKAKFAAINDAGLDNSDVTFESVRLMNMNRKMIYMTEFKCMGIDYKFGIDAIKGEIVSREVEYED